MEMSDSYLIEVLASLFRRRAAAREFIHAKLVVSVHKRGNDLTELLSSKLDVASYRLVGVRSHSVRPSESFK